MTSVEKLLSEAFANHSPKPKQTHSLNVKQQLEELRIFAQAYAVRHNIKLGDAVRVKRELAHIHAFPKAGTPAVVMEILPEVERNRDDAGSAYYGGREDCRIATMLPDGAICMYTYDSYMLEPWTE